MYTLLWAYQSLVCSASSRSIYQTNLTRIRRILAYAKLNHKEEPLVAVKDDKIGMAAPGTYFLPRQSRGPIEKAWKVSLRSLSNRWSPSHRSGMKSSS